MAHRTACYGAPRTKPKGILMSVPDHLLRDAGIVGDALAPRPSINGDDSRSRSHREKEPGRNELVEVWKLPEPEPRRSIIEGLMPEGALTILFGDGGLGKSY